MESKVIHLITSTPLKKDSAIIGLGTERGEPHSRGGEIFLVADGVEAGGPDVPRVVHVVVVAQDPAGRAGDRGDADLVDGAGHVGATGHVLIDPGGHREAGVHAGAGVGRRDHEVSRDTVAVAGADPAVEDDGAVIPGPRRERGTASHIPLVVPVPGVGQLAGAADPDPRPVAIRRVVGAGHVAVLGCDADPGWGSAFDVEPDSRW